MSEKRKLKRKKEGKKMLNIICFAFIFIYTSDYNLFLLLPEYVKQSILLDVSSEMKQGQVTHMHTHKKVILLPFSVLHVKRE